MNEKNTQVLITGAGFGGVSAALSCARMGKKVILTEETRWIGGQATTQGVPLDEHPWIESFGRNRSYAAFRQGVRSYYRNHYPLTPKAMGDPCLNPGAGWVSGLCFEPKAGLAVLYQMLAPYITSGLIEILTSHRAVSAETDHDRCRAVVIENLLTGEKTAVSAEYFLDGTELGELLPLAGVEHVFGAESAAETGEPSALAGDADPLRQQPFTHLIAVDYLPGENHVGDMPENYKYWRDKSFAAMNTAKTRPFFPDPSNNEYQPCVWNFRRCFCRDNFEAGAFPSDITMLMNGNQYREGVLMGVSEQEKQAAFQQAAEKSLALLYFLQTEFENGYNGKPGFPGLRARGDVLGTETGLAQYPYIRESRRIKAEFTVLEQHFSTELCPDGPVPYHDSVGLGGYRVDIHLPSSSGKSITQASHGKHWVQQIPLGALIPVRMQNVLPCGKNLGTTHITNGAFRLHPVEWNVGEAAGILAAHCIDVGLTPTAVRNSSQNLEKFKRIIVRHGIETRWPVMLYGRSYYSHFSKTDGWYYGEASRLI